MPCLIQGNLVLCRPGRMRRKVIGKTRRLWCFKCRKRLVHDKVMLTEIKPSYYEPIFELECRGCGENQTDFPGTERL